MDWVAVIRLGFYQIYVFTSISNEIMDWDQGFYQIYLSFVFVFTFSNSIYGIWSLYKIVMWVFHAIKS